MAVYALDTSVIVAALMSWHEDHEPARTWVQRVLGQNNTVLLPVHVLVETYSVMTRLPAPHRISPQTAYTLLSGSFRGATKVVGVDQRSTWRWLETLVNQRIAGGRVYDALILACASHGGATHLLTLNPRDFDSLADGLEVVAPEPHPG